MEFVSKPFVGVEYMPQTGLSAVVRHIRKLASTNDTELSDRHFLERFAEKRDEAAFTALVQRHGGMVLGVARRVLGHEQDAEDTFQATFLILARKARTIRQDSVGAWLHQVAHRVALKARRIATKRKQKERREPGTDSPSSLDDITWRELRVLLDEELAKLPKQQHQAVVLCCLEGVKHADAARQFGWTLATLRRRLAQGRDDRPVVAEREAKSISSETTFDSDISDKAELTRILLVHCDRLAGRLRKEGLSARGVTLKLRLPDFSLRTRSRAGMKATQLDDSINPIFALA